MNQWPCKRTYHHMWRDLNSNKMKSSFQLQLDLYLVENPVKIELTVPEIYPLLWCSNNEIQIRKLNSNICCVWKSILASSDSFCLISSHMIIIFSIDNFDCKFNFTNSFQVPSFTMFFSWPGGRNNIWEPRFSHFKYWYFVENTSSNTCR